MKLARVPWPGPGAPTEADLRRRLESEGFAVFPWTDPPGRTYAPHHHDHDESLYGVKGLVTFHIAGEDLPLEPGDRLLLPRGTVHAATVGPEGATYLIGER